MRLSIEGMLNNARSRIEFEISRDVGDGKFYFAITSDDGMSVRGIDEMVPKLSSILPIAGV